MSGKIKAGPIGGLEHAPENTLIAFGPEMAGQAGDSILWSVWIKKCLTDVAAQNRETSKTIARIGVQMLVIRIYVPPTEINVRRWGDR